jgi:hypothetical protein
LQPSSSDNPVCLCLINAWRGVWVRRGSRRGTARVMRLQKKLQEPPAKTAITLIGSAPGRAACTVPARPPKDAPPPRGGAVPEAGWHSGFR